MRQLFNLAEKDDVNDLDFNIYEPSMSAFAELFMEREKMKVLNGLNDTTSVLNDQNKIIILPVILSIISEQVSTIHIISY